jgi:hypothetical protein
MRLNEDLKPVNEAYAASLSMWMRARAYGGLHTYPSMVSLSYFYISDDGALM